MRSVITSSGSIEGREKRALGVLLSVKTQFPFDLFPDKLIIDKNKVSIVENHLLTSHIHSILYEDITEVSVNTNPIFAAITIQDSNNPRFPQAYSLGYLNKNDALLARCIIQGMVKAVREGIEFDKTSCDDMVKAANKLGRVKI